MYFKNRRQNRMPGLSLCPDVTKPNLTEIRKKCRKNQLLSFDYQSIWPKSCIGTMIDDPKPKPIQHEP
jgi:hypothetical protein